MRRVLERVGVIIDAHAHLPVGSFPHRYLEDLASAGISAVVLLGIPDFSKIIASLSLEDVVKEYERTRSVIERHVPRELWDNLRPEVLYLSALELAREYGPLCGLLEDEALIQSLISIEETGPEFVIFHAVQLDKAPDDVKEEAEEAVKRGAKGLKIISTLFMKSLDDPSVEAAIEAAEELDIPVIVHAGCDPGVWELPKYCKYGDPSRLEPVIKQHREARIVIAHVGGYSAIAPGVFVAETLELLRRYPNVYADTSALNPVVVEMAAKDAPCCKLLFGTDYPVINKRPEDIVVEYYDALIYAGVSRRFIEAYFHGLAEEVLEIKLAEKQVDTSYA